MNLTTHWALAFAFGIALTHNVELSLIISIGALIPDLDREYLFVARDFIGKHQLHRALFHNVFIIGLLYFLNPYLALGALSHTLLDAFTSATDRGVELFFPLTRLVRSYIYDIEGRGVNNQRKIMWWVADTSELVRNTSDRELQDPGDRPWLRSYGPFRNSRIIDWCLFFSSTIFLVVTYLVFRDVFYSMTGFRILSLTAILGIAIFYGLGEFYRRRLATELYFRRMMKSFGLEPIKTNWVVLLFLIVGLLIFGYSGFQGGVFLLQPLSVPDFVTLSVGLASCLLGLIIAYLLVRVRKSEDIAV
jgi:hypothetical protein